jgi:serine/threonine-protein kinase
MGVDRYAVLRPLGAGAMGTVSLCHDRRLGRDVAMKVMQDGLARDPAARLRFEREARVQGQLEHAAIVPVHDIGVTEDGSPFFTMKRVQGQSLHAVLGALRRGDPAAADAYGPRRLLNAFASVCQAVALAHSRGIIHRDIKPANVMFGDFGEVYLLDWGVAKVRTPGPADATQPAIVWLPSPVAEGGSGMGMMLGTIGYMAPEQARGEPVDERADVYSLGVILFEILTLQRLHPAGAPAALESTLRGPEARPSLRAPERRVPRELDDLCVRATALDARDRPAGARELHDAIERVLDGDRDLERRRRLSSEHAARARVLAQRALAAGPGSDEARERAIEEAHSAIVLDAANAGAVETLASLARSPAATTLRDAEDALRAATMRIRRNLGATGAVLFLPWLVGVGFGCLLGLRAPLFPILGAVALVCGAVLAFCRSRVDSGWFTFGALLCAEAAAAMSGAAFGPFLLVPGLVACLAVAFTVASQPLHGLAIGDTPSRLVRHAARIVGLLAFLGPLALEWAGVLPPSMAVRDGALVILPRAVDFPARWTIPFLTAVNAVLILVPALIASRIRDHSLRVEHEVFRSMATIRRLLPDAAQTAIARDLE